MRPNYVFLIDTDSSEHRLSVDGNGIGTFPILAAATSEAFAIARRFVPTATLSFELDFKWALSDSDIRAAVVECPSNQGRG